MTLYTLETWDLKNNIREQWTTAAEYTSPAEALRNILSIQYQLTEIGELDKFTKENTFRITKDNPLESLAEEEHVNWSATPLEPEA